MIRLELGGGHSPTPGYVNMDPVHGEGEFHRRAQDGPFPLGDRSVHQARASHVMEHIPAGEPRIHVMNEVWRVLERGGTFEVKVPLFWPGKPEGAIADPTHVSLWTRRSFDYFTGAWPVPADYGIHFWRRYTWSEIECDWGTEGCAVLVKP